MSVIGSSRAGTDDCPLTDKPVKWQFTSALAADLWMHPLRKSNDSNLSLDSNSRLFCEKPHGMASSTVSSANTDADTAAGSLSCSSTEPAILQKKLAKIEKCIAVEEALLAAIQDKFIQLGMLREENPGKHHSKVRELEQANDKASRHIEEFRRKKRKYEMALKTHEELTRQDAVKMKKETKDSRSGFSLDRETGAKMLNMIRAKNGDSGSARSKDSRGSKDESPAPTGDMTGYLKVLPSEVSISSVDSDSHDSQKWQRRLDEMMEAVQDKLNPLAGDMTHVMDELKRISRLLEEGKSEITDERKANNTIFDDIIRRCTYVEEQIHDLIELHQKETAETKTYLVDTQDKMNYVFHERVRDLKDEITGLVTRIAKIEHRQREDESLARTEAAKSVLGEMAFKMVDCVLLFGQLVIAVVGAVSHFFQMTAENSTRLVVFLVGVIAVLVLFQFREDLPFYGGLIHWTDALIDRIQPLLPERVLRMLGASTILPSGDSVEGKG